MRDIASEEGMVTFSSIQEHEDRWNPQTDEIAIKGLESRLDWPIGVDGTGWIDRATIINSIIVQYIKLYGSLQLTLNPLILIENITISLVYILCCCTTECVIIINYDNYRNLFLFCLKFILVENITFNCLYYSICWGTHNSICIHIYKYTHIFPHGRNLTLHDYINNNLWVKFFKNIEEILFSFLF